MKKSILLIEDDENIRFLLRVFLESENYQVYEAENGLKALQILEKIGLPNLILTDILMPVMSGWKFASEFASIYDSKVPIIVMTAAADAEQRAKDVQAVAWIEKPVGLDRLLALIKQHER